MKTVINDAISALSAIPELEWVDDNLGQLSHGQTMVNFPCALVRIESIDQTNFSGGGLLGEATLEITLACNPVIANPPEKIHSVAESLYDLIRKIDQALQSLDGDVYGPVSRVKISSDLTAFPAKFILLYSTVLYE